MNTIIFNSADKYTEASLTKVSFLHCSTALANLKFFSLPNPLEQLICEDQEGVANLWSAVSRVWISI